MSNLLLRLESLTFDNKRNLLIGMTALLLIVVYAISHRNDTPQLVVEEAKNEDFKSGSITSDETPEFYRKKDELVRQQNQSIIANQKALEEKVQALSQKLEGSPVARQLTAAGTSPPTESTDPNQAPAEEQGKKLNRRGQNQSRINSLLDTRVA